MSDIIKILLVEDDKNAGYLLSENLKGSGYNISLAHDGVEGYEKFKEQEFNLCILDIMLPLQDGFELAKKIKQVNKQIPIIFLSARNLDADKIEGFHAGCDDYVTKPFNVNELKLRIKAILKRNTTSDNKQNSNVFNFGSSVFDFNERFYKNKVNKIKLSTKEAGILSALISDINSVVSRKTIMEKVWGKDDYFISKSLDVYLTKIRKHLSEDENIQLINVHGFGYKLFEKK